MIWILFGEATRNHSEAGVPARGDPGDSNHGKCVSSLSWATGPGEAIRWLSDLFHTQSLLLSPCPSVSNTYTLSLSPPTPQQLEPGASEGSRNKRVSLENLGLGQVDRVVQVCRLDPRVSGGKATGLQ